HLLLWRGCSQRRAQSQLGLWRMAQVVPLLALTALTLTSAQPALAGVQDGLRQLSGMGMDLNLDGGTSMSNGMDVGSSGSQTILGGDGSMRVDGGLSVSNGMDGGSSWSQTIHHGGSSISNGMDGGVSGSSGLSGGSSMSSGMDGGSSWSQTIHHGGSSIFNGMDGGVSGSSGLSGGSSMSSGMDGGSSWSQTIHHGGSSISNGMDGGVSGSSGLSGGSSMSSGMDGGSSWSQTIHHGGSSISNGMDGGVSGSSGLGGGVSGSSGLGGGVSGSSGLGGGVSGSSGLGGGVSGSSGLGGGVSGSSGLGGGFGNPGSEDSPAFTDAGKCRGREEEWVACDLPSCKTCEPQDCVFAEWMEWFPLGGCTGLCQRKRLKAQTNNECGQPCSGSLLQTVFRRECYPDYAACVSETRDCVWSAWTSWSSTCFGDGRELRLNQRFRSRNVLKQALANGQLCIGPYNQTEPCIAETFERRDCGLSHWSEWTHCSRPCGGGWQARIRRVVQYASNGGTPCEDVTREQQPCHIEPCGGESCVLSEWGDWQGCDILSTAQEYRSRELLQPASDETPCDQTLRETRGCPEDDEVPEVCKLNAWTEWTVCSATCAGQQQRSRRLPSNQPRCFLDATVVGEGVPVQEIQACGAPRCEAAVCRLSVWTEWSGCSQGCGDGIHTRSREILESSAHASCDEALEQVRPCRMQDCVALDCVWADWDEWSACSCTCGGGTMRRNRVIQQSPRHGGRTCDPEEKGQIAPCATQSCEMCVDGRWSSWGSWSRCSATCSASYKARHRSVDRHPNYCGRPAVGLEDQYEVCENQPNCVPDKDCVLSAWSTWTGCSCKCFGVRERHRAVEQYASGNGKPCLEESLKFVEPCAPGPGQAVPTDCKPDPARPCQMGDWEEWQSCSASCDTGERKRARNILIPAADDGPPCEDPTEQVEPCNTQACHMTCVDCLWSQWSEWSACSHCGHQRYRHRGITRQANHCGKKCDTQAAKEVGFCPSKCEERYCVWSSWQDMGGCSAKCGPSTRLLHRELKFTTRLPEPEVEPIGNSGGLCRDALGRSYSGCPIQALSLEDCSEGLRKLGGVRGVQGAMFDRGDVVKFGARRCFILVDPGTMIQTVDVPGGWMKTPCIEGKGAGPITSAGTASGADTWKCLTLTNMPLIIGDPSVPCSGTQIYQSTCDSKPCRDECVPVDCELGEWSQWSEPSCTELCERSRTIARSNECGGKPCGGLLVETKRCYKNCTAPVDCKLGEWGSWAPAECMTPTDQKERERAVLVVAENGGRACAGVMRETMACSEDQEPVNDCELGQFSEWSACTATCGSGLRTQSRSIQVEASGGGSPCKGPLALLQPCSLGPCECPVTDAVLSQWGEWSGCNSGMHLRKRQVSQSAKCGGQPAKGGLMEVKRCGEVIDCEVSEWTGWDECDKSCGGGQQQRHRQVTRNPLNGGMRCPKDLVVTQGCNQEPCHATSCEVTEWEAWGECSSSCGSGVHERRRTFLHLAEDGGSGCDLPLSDMKPCSAEGRRLQSCPPTDCGCVWRDWSEWSACTCECGGGQKTRNRHIARAPLPGCTPCEPSDKQQILPCNTQKCQEDECVDGLWGLWQEWEPCSSTCKGGITWRMRKIARHASDCGRPVEGVSQHHASCNEGVSCVESTDCQLGEWAAWSACTQACDGVKRRSRQIAVQGRGDGAYCIGPMHQTYPCSTDKGLLEFSSPALYLHLDKLVEKNVDRGQAQLKYGDVTKLPGDESSVDLVVAATSAMQSIDPERTGLHGSVGSVATEPGTSVDVEFILMKSGTTEEVRAKMLMLKLFDLSDGSKLEVKDCDEPFLARETQLTVHGEDGVVITSQMPGTSAPKDPMSVSPRQEMQAAAILFKDTSRARVTFTSGSGEGLLFAGKACWSGDCLISACGRGDDSVDCVMNEWQPWGPCSVSCGRGQRVRSRTVQSLNSHGGRPCHTDLSETEGCRAVSCAEACEAQDCVWSDWSDWGACDKCGGQMKRFRNVITPSSCGGKGCEAEGAEETAKCPRKCHELSYCTWGDWGPFGECTSTCGHGIKRRTRRLKVVDEPVKSIIGESFMGTEDLKDKFHELQQRAVQLEAARSQQLVVAFACGFLGLVAFVAAGRRSSWATASDYSRVAGSDQE
ncbi:unnamed protein product, partial [Effrenium voratum]